MYKLLLCWRYLLTRYLALACIVSVMLGVATLIVVNSVMSGFSTKLRDRLHGLLSDVLIEASNTYTGFADPDKLMQRVRQDPFLRDRIEAMTPTLEVYAMLQFRLSNGQMMMRAVRLIGVDPATRGAVGGFTEFLLDPKDRKHPSFALPAEVKKRLADAEAWRQAMVLQQYHEAMRKFEEDKKNNPSAAPPVWPAPSDVKLPPGIIIGNAIASFRMKNPKGQTGIRDIYMLQRGSEVRVVTYKGGDELSPANAPFIVTDFSKTDMSEYDSNYVFVHIKELQRLRDLDNHATSIQIKLKDFKDAPQVVKALQRIFSPDDFRVQTWEDKQGALLAAISIEKGILNILLFLIIGVAGFGILAIFAMIVAEKTRDIGILKALGASNAGVMKIFLGYGLLLGLVGASLGTVLGLSFTLNINAIEQVLTKITGQDFFPRDVYYFDKIPTYINPLSVFLVNLGAVGIAVLASVLPALRAALLHPVRALRYE